MTKISPTPDVVDDDDEYYTAPLQAPQEVRAMMNATPARRMDKSCQGPRRSCSQSHSSSSGDPTKYKQALKTPPESQVARVGAAVKLCPPFSSMAVSGLEDEDDAVVQE